MEDINSKKKKLTNRAELINLSTHPYLNQPCISFFSYKLYFFIMEQIRGNVFQGNGVHSINEKL